MISNLEMMMWLNGKIKETEKEISYISGTLTEINGPAKGLVSALKDLEEQLKGYKEAYASRENK